MGATKDIMIRMQEEEYYSIPYEIRERHFSSKMLTPELNDFNELMNDEIYKLLYKDSKKAKKRLEDYTHELREKNRKLNK